MLLLLVGMGSAWAQPRMGNLNFHQLTTKNGLSSNLVNCLFQDSRGFVWVGTGNGLNRYDGIGFTTYGRQAANFSSLASNHINNLCEAPNGDIWVGTNQGVSRLNPYTQQTTNYLSGSNCFVYADKKGTVWVSNGGQLGCFHPAQNQFTQYPVELGQGLNITRNFNIGTLFQDSQGHLWLPTSYGVQLFNPTTGRFRIWHFPEQERAAGQNAITTIGEAPNGDIYAATWGAGLLLLNKTDSQFIEIKLAQPPQSDNIFPVNIVHDLLFDGDQVWLATENGLVRTSWQALRPGQPVSDYTLYAHQANDGRSLADNEVKALLQDRAGNIWVGNQGVSWFAPMQQNFVTLRNLTDKGKKLGPTAFVAPIEGQADQYFFGSYDMYRVDAKQGTVKPLQLDKSMYNALFGSVVWDIAAGKKGYWLATTNGLLQLNERQQLIKKYPGMVNGKGTLPSERLWKVYEDSRGWVWVSSVRHGIGLVNPTTGTVQNCYTQQGETNSLFNIYTSGFFEDGQGNIWWGGNGKLYAWQAASAQFAVYQLPSFTTQRPQPLLQAKDGNIWLASELGLHLFNPINQQLTPMLPNHPELNSGDCATVDQQGHLWVGTNSGLFCFDTATHTLKKFTSQNGLESNDNFNSIYTMPNGDILLGGDGYITRFNPQQLRSNSFVPPVVITKVQVNGYDTALLPNVPFSLPYHSSIGFEFAALNFSNAEKNQYQYMLQGIDKQWVAANGQRNVLYGELPPGKYIFKVKGSNDDGVWNETPAQFAFTIPTPWYRSAWFIVPSLLLLAVLLYAAYRYRLRQALAMERMRTRIATDLHDDIGATLSSISMYSEAVKNQLKGQNPQLENVLHKMGESSREMVTSMSDIVWAISPGNDDGDKLIKRMESYAADLCAVRGMVLHFSADEKMAALQLPLEHRKNIYLIFKESVNNAVKYAEAKNIWVQLAMEGKKISLLVKDDGKGYDPATVRPGNGLKNLPLRATEIGGQLTITAEEGKGVEVRLVV